MGIMRLLRRLFSFQPAPGAGMTDAEWIEQAIDPAKHKDRYITAVLGGLAPALDGEEKLTAFDISGARAKGVALVLIGTGPRTRQNLWAAYQALAAAEDQEEESGF
jgi:hypothetical protein